MSVGANHFFREIDATVEAAVRENKLRHAANATAKIQDTCLAIDPELWDDNRFCVVILFIQNGLVLTSEKNSSKRGAGSFRLPVIETLNRFAVNLDFVVIYPVIVHIRYPF